MAEKNDFQTRNRESDVENNNTQCDFNTYYELFLSKQGHCPSKQTDSSLLSTPVASTNGNDSTAIEHHFRSCYEQFVGYSVDDRLFQTCAEASAFRNSSRGLSPTTKSLLRHSLMGVGSLAATAAIGALLIHSAGDTPRYTYREFSPELFQQESFAPSTSAQSDTVTPLNELSRNDTERPQANLVLPQSLEETDRTSQSTVNYSVVVPDLVMQPDMDMSTVWRLSDSLPTTPVPDDGMLEQVALDSAVLPQSVEPSVSATVEPSAGESTLVASETLPMPFSFENTNVDTAIAFRRFDETASMDDSALLDAEPLTKVTLEKDQMIPSLEALAD